MSLIICYCIRKNILMTRLQEHEWWARTKPIEILELAFSHNSTQFAIEDQNNEVLYPDRLQGTSRWSFLDWWRNDLLKRDQLDCQRHRHHTILNQIIINAVFILMNCFYYIANERCENILPFTPAVTDIRKIKINKFILKMIFHCRLKSVVQSILFMSVDKQITPSMRDQ